jgi:hypothetical protein
MNLLMIGIACLLLFGCSDSSEPGSSEGKGVSGRVEVVPPSTAAVPQQQDALAATRRVYSWPEGHGEARDKDADIQTCQDRIHAEDPNLAKQKALVSVARHIGCMEKLGWKLVRYE